MSAAAVRSIVVAYEDLYCDALHLLLKRLRRDRGLPGLVLELWPVRGTGNFMLEVPRILRLPLKQTRRPPDLVVCVGDADRPANLTADAPVMPGAADGLDAWVRELERVWRESLVRGGRLAEGDAARLSTVCLRWNKESLLVASPEALIDHARAYGRDVALATWLGANCDPEPFGLVDDAYTRTYRKPAACMDGVMHVIDGRKYKKGRDDEDILMHRIADDPTRRAQVLRRCPDLERLLAMLV